MKDLKDRDDYLAALKETVRRIGMQSGVEFEVDESGDIQMHSPSLAAAGSRLTNTHPDFFKNAFPRSSRDLITNIRRVAFLYNGLCSVPAYLSSRGVDITVVDPFDLGDLAEDVETVLQRLKANGLRIPYGFLERIKGLGALLDASENGMQTCQYDFSSQRLPFRLGQNFDVVVNCYGVNSSTLPAQLAMLNEGGWLLTTNEVAKNSTPSNFDILQLPTRSGNTAFQVRRMS